MCIRDSEIIALASRFFESLGLTKIELMLNSLGDSDSRELYNAALIKYLDANEKELSHQSQETMTRNPLRVLDSKREEDEEIIRNAPIITDFLNDDNKEHFQIVQDGLDLLGITYQLAPRLVRGLDYYTKTTFEFVAPSLDLSLIHI